MAVTVHFEQNGEVTCLLLDLIEVARTHSGANLAAVFAKVLADFGIADKVSLLSDLHESMGLTVAAWPHMPDS